MRTLLLPRNTGFEFGVSEAPQPAEFHFPNFVRALLSAALTMNPPNFFAELKRRNVIRVAGLSLVGAWLLIQVASTMRRIDCRESKTDPGSDPSRPSPPKESGIRLLGPGASCRWSVVPGTPL